MVCVVFMCVCLFVFSSTSNKSFVKFIICNYINIYEYINYNHTCMNNISMTFSVTEIQKGGVTYEAPLMAALITRPASKLQFPFQNEKKDPVYVLQLETGPRCK